MCCAKKLEINFEQKKYINWGLFTYSHTFFGRGWSSPEYGRVRFLYEDLAIFGWWWREGKVSKRQKKFCVVIYKCEQSPKHLSYLFHLLKHAFNVAVIFSHFPFHNELRHQSSWCANSKSIPKMKSNRQFTRNHIFLSASSIRLFIIVGMLYYIVLVALQLP